VSIPESRVSMPEHTLSQPAHHNVGTHFGLLCAPATFSLPNFAPPESASALLQGFCRSSFWIPRGITTQHRWGRTKETSFKASEAEGPANLNFKFKNPHSRCAFLLLFHDLILSIHSLTALDKHIQFLDRVKSI
jgi:hypothetical protein